MAQGSGELSERSPGGEVAQGSGELSERSPGGEVAQGSGELSERSPGGEVAQGSGERELRCIFEQRSGDFVSCFLHSQLRSPGVAIILFPFN